MLRSSAAVFRRPRLMATRPAETLLMLPPDADEMHMEWRRLRSEDAVSKWATTSS